MRVHAYLERHGLINFGVYKRLEPPPGQCVHQKVLFMSVFRLIGSCSHIDHPVNIAFLYFADSHVGAPRISFCKLMQVYILSAYKK